VRPFAWRPIERCFTEVSRGLFIRRVRVGQNLKRLGNERGSVLVLTAVWMALLLGFLAFASDMGMLLIQRRMAQTAADAAAIAGNAEINWASSDGTTVTAAAQAAAAENGFTNGSNGVTVTVNDPPLSGPYTGNSSYVEVIVQRNVPTFFLNLLNQNTMTVSARAVSGMGGDQGCVDTLGTSGYGILITGSSTVDLPGCSLMVNSSSSTAVYGTGTTSVTASQIGIVGGYSVAGGVSPTPVTINPVADPLAYLPQPTVPSGCSSSLTYGGSSTASATYGCFTGIALSHGATLSLGPGLYVINGDVSVVGDAVLSGSNVTIYTTGSITVSNSATVSLTAPTTGTYNGILFFQSRTDSSADSLTGNVAPAIQGIFYAPDASMTITGSSSANIYASFVVSSLTLTGNTTIKSYGTINGSNPLLTPTLAE
jgi:Flp pilus assembly protein TadG